MDNVISDYNLIRKVYNWKSVLQYEIFFFYKISLSCYINLVWDLLYRNSYRSRLQDKCQGNALKPDYFCSFLLFQFCLKIWSINKLIISIAVSIIFFLFSIYLDFVYWRFKSDFFSLRLTFLDFKSLYSYPFFLIVIQFIFF